MKMNMKMKKTAVLLAIVLASPAAFSDGYFSTLPIQVQLHQEAITIRHATTLLNHGASVTKMTPRVERIDVEVQNTAARMPKQFRTPFSNTRTQHVKPFAHNLPTKATRADILGNLEVAGQFTKMYMQVHANWLSCRLDPFSFMNCGLPY
jgi:ParB-like chromosome segregation protein Spo0J